ncbi:hypothetical protein ACE6H2_000105 [Prunus campanulata]
MAHKIKNINASLLDLKSEASFIGLVSKKIDTTPPEIGGARETDSIFEEDEVVFGRNEVLSNIITTLTNSNLDQENLSVMPIVGMGGLGKTTLAKSVFNDDSIGRHFGKKIWVCVSDTFEVKSILSWILEYLNPKKAGIQRQDALLKNLVEELKEKRYFLVLDDVWNEDREKWSKLMTCLSKLHSTQGSVVIVTTRSAIVASITEKVLQRCVLESLSVDDCWDILKKRAFPYGNAPIPKDLETIGKEIARKCAGIPLTAKVLGSMMCSKDSINDWLEIQKSEIWELQEGDERIMSVLKLSFDHLKSPSLKQCFAYCSKFKKDFEMEREDLIQLWMAQGFLCSSPNKDMEDIGDEYFTILLQNSLFQDVIRDDFGIITHCKMHDLVYDLAQLVSRSEMEDKLENQHVAWDPSKSSERNIEKRRSLFVNEDQALCNNTLLISFKALRVLNLYRADIEELPSSIGVLIHLRYLNISETNIEQLPQSIGKLYNLQTLRMKNARLLTFPKAMENLINLRHVYFSSRKRVPFGIGRLKHLQTISPFILGKKSNRGIDQLGGLNQLKGELIIEGLEHVRDRGQAGASNLVGKANLRRLTLNWGWYGRERDEKDIDVLEGLRPNSELEILRIDRFMGTKLASWMMSGSLPLNLTEIRLMDCGECEQVPSLGHLPNLRLVHLEGMRKLKCVGVEFYGYNHVNGAATSTKKKETLFPALKSLEISRCIALIKWEEPPTDEKVAVFPCLEELSIQDCHSLKFIPITLGKGKGKGMPCLRKLEIQACEKLSSLPTSLEFCISLQELEIFGCGRLTSLPSGLPSCTSLKKLRIEVCNNLISLHSLPSGLRELLIGYCWALSSWPSGLEYCTSLRRLSINSCFNLTSIPLSQSDSDAPTLPLLEDLTIRGCFSLEFIPITLGKGKGMSCLRKLEIEDCDGLTSLPSGLPSCTSLNKLRIESCHKLRSLPDLDVSRLQSLSSLHISNFGKLYYLPIGLRSLTRLESMKMGPFSKELYSFPDFELPSQIQTLEITGWFKLKSLPQQIQHSTSLTSLEIESFDGVKALPEWLGNLTSLIRLSIKNCWNLVSLPTVEVMQRLTKLEVLGIDNCPRLGGRSALKSGPEWHKISHIPNIIVDGCESSESFRDDDSTPSQTS